MNVLAAFGKQTFSSFAIPTYRRYFVGQGLSHIGSWMQTVALGWLVIVLTGSGVALGSVLAVRFAPLLFGAIMAGNLVDSFDKRRLLIATQSAAAIISLTVGALIYAGLIEMWMVYVAALSKGLVDMLDRPARQTFVHEIVGPENLRNAVSLNSSMANTARALGPLFAGSIIATLGIAVCYLANAPPGVASIACAYGLSRRCRRLCRASLGDGRRLDRRRIIYGESQGRCEERIYRMGVPLRRLGVHRCFDAVAFSCSPRDGRRRIFFRGDERDWNHDDTTRIGGAHARAGDGAVVYGNIRLHAHRRAHHRIHW